MRIAKVVLALVGAVALAGCIIHPRGHHSGRASVEYQSDGHPGGPPPGRGWRK